MKATGIVRRIDDLGRIVIPKEIRRSLAIREGDPLELYVNTKDHTVVFKKYQVAEEYDAETIQRLLNAIFGKIKWAVFVRQDLLTTNDLRFPDDLDAIDIDDGIACRLSFEFLRNRTSPADFFRIVVV